MNEAIQYICLMSSDAKKACQGQSLKRIVLDIKHLKGVFILLLCAWYFCVNADDVGFNVLRCRADILGTMCE